jgi:hypothetical protein
VFGPPTGQPCPEVIACCTKRRHAAEIVNAVNSYAKLLAEHAQMREALQRIEGICNATGRAGFIPDIQRNAQTALRITMNTNGKATT